jgi:hypothetical protein
MFMMNTRYISSRRWNLSAFLCSDHLLSDTLPVTLFWTDREPHRYLEIIWTGSRGHILENMGTLLRYLSYCSSRTQYDKLQIFQIL